METQLNFPSHPKNVFFHKAVALSLSMNGSHFDVPFPVARLLLRHGELSLIHLYTMQLTSSSDASEVSSKQRLKGAFKDFPVETTASCTEEHLAPAIISV